MPKHIISIDELLVGNTFEATSVVANSGGLGDMKWIWAVVRWDNVNQRASGFYRVNNRSKIVLEDGDLHKAIAAYNELS